MSETFWCCSPTNRAASPEKRLAEVCAAAERNLGYLPEAIHVHPETYAVTERLPRIGMMLIADTNIPSPFEYRFLRREPSPKAESRP